MGARDYLHLFKNVKPCGNYSSARCPSHQDTHNSLSIWEDKNGRLMVKCHANAGCTYQSICQAAGIEKQSSRQIVASYDYRDEQGILLYQVVRYEPKGFSQRRPEGNGWAYKLNGTRRVLYRWPELLEADPTLLVVVVEGEKDADRLAANGIIATTNAGGAGKWRDENSEALRGRHVLIIPDNDEAGRGHAAKVACSLRGVAASVRILELPNLPPKGDVSDWLDAGGDVDELLRLALDTPVVEEPPTPAVSLPEGAALRIMRMADVQPKQVDWLFYPFIPLRKLTIVEGDPGLGKSWLMCALSAGVTCGQGLPGADPFEPGNVLMLSAEDGLADTLRPRLDAVGADVSRIFALDGVVTFDSAGLVRLEAAIIEYSPVLVIIDPLFAFTGGKVDIHRANECRAISAPLAAIAERCGCALVAVRHLGKSRGGGHALNAGIGSIDLTAAARSVLLVGQDPDEPSKRAIVQTKNNLAPLGQSIGYTLENGQFFWTGASDLTAGRILAAATSEEAGSCINEAIDFLRSALSEGPRDNKEVKKEAKQAGISEATLRRATQRLGIKPRKLGGPGSEAQKWVWELPASEVDHKSC